MVLSNGENPARAGNHFGFTVKQDNLCISQGFTRQWGPPPKKAFLDLAHLENTDLRVDSQPLALGVLAHDVADELAPLGEARQVRLRVEVHATWDVQGDSRRLHQAVSNLVSNAIRYSLIADEVVIKLYNSGRCVRIEVIDKGPGVEAGIRDSLFERYTRARLLKNPKKGRTIERMSKHFLIGWSLLSCVLFLGCNDSSSAKNA